MEIERRERDPDTGEIVGEGFSDVFAKIAAKLTGKTAKKLQQKQQKKELKKLGKKLANLWVKKFMTNLQSEAAKGSEASLKKQKEKKLERC